MGMDGAGVARLTCGVAVARDCVAVAVVIAALDAALDAAVGGALISKRSPLVAVGEASAG